MQLKLVPLLKSCFSRFNKTCYFPIIKVLKISKDYIFQIILLSETDLDFEKKMEVSGDTMAQWCRYDL